MRRSNGRGEWPKRDAGPNRAPSGARDAGPNRAPSGARYAGKADRGDGGPRPVSGAGRSRENRPSEPPVNRSWGSVARKGARVLNETDRGPASSAWQAAVVRARTGGDDGPEDVGDIWIRDDEPEPDPKRPARPVRSTAVPRSPSRLRHTVPSQVTAELAGAAGVMQGARLAEKLAEASHAYDRDRYQDALRILRSLARSVPGSGAVRELLGLTLYRMGRWRPALKEFDVYRALGGGYDQHPVLMDCHRALKSYRQVDALWEELRQASPSAEVVAEGRIVMAGALADRGDLPAATRLLEKGATVRKPREHHLRQWYALADLYERGGDVPRARDLFGRIDAVAPASFDTAQRLRALR